MVQKRTTLREKIIAALTKKSMSAAQLMVVVGTTKSGVRDPINVLRKEKLIEKVGERDLPRGFGVEVIWGLVVPKKKAVNAFDWRNWETQAHFSKREMAYSNSQFLNQTEKRVIVYSRA